MQMLTAGGMEALSDGIRGADHDNPRGYFEWERIRTLPQDPECIAAAEGKVVKVISSLLRFLPDGREYKIIFMRRSIAEVAASQAAMIARKGAQPHSAPDTIASALDAHLKQVTAWLQSRSDLKVCWIDYAQLIANPRSQAEAMAALVGLPLDLDAMCAQIQPSLHRNRI